MDPRPQGMAPSRRHAERGVTLIELMMVIVIIGIFTTMAAPTIVSTLQDRHAARGADEVQMLFRRARTRASSYGAAHIVRVMSSGSNLRFELRMAVNATSGFAVSNCLASTWTATGPENLLVDTVDFDAGPTYAGKQIVATSLTGVGDYCYTPGGTPWWRISGVWSRPASGLFLQFVVNRQNDLGVPFGITRTVTIGATGVPQMRVE